MENVSRERTINSLADLKEPIRRLPVEQLSKQRHYINKLQKSVRINPKEWKFGSYSTNLIQKPSSKFFV